MSSRHGRPERHRTHWWRRIWSHFWVLPSVVALVSVALGLALPHLDERMTASIPYVFESGPDGARQLLGTIGSAMISVTGLVFSITMVVLQLASSQFTPRLLGQFLQSRIVQLTLGVFTGSFLYALTVMRLVRGGSSGGSPFVPQASVTVAFLYVLASVGFFLAFINHITESVRLSHVLARIGDRTRECAAVLYAGERPSATWSPAPGTGRREVHLGDRRGSVTTIDSSGLTRWAADHDCVVELSLSPGDYVTAGDSIGRVWGGSAALDAERVERFVDLGRERHLDVDFGYGLRQLTDIADRALSPGINDPTTAVQVIDELYGVLVTVVTEPDLSPYLVDDDGAVRATYRVQKIDQLLATSLGEIWHYAKDSSGVRERVKEVTTKLAEVAAPQHRATLATFKGHLESAGPPGDPTGGVRGPKA